MSVAARPTRPLRADAQRNRDALVAAAREVFAARGPEVSMLEIAAAAGVGNGTLYRHFPERRSLIAAAYLGDLLEVCAEADRLLADCPADQAIERWLLLMVEHVRVHLPLKLVLMRIPAVADWSPPDPLPAVFSEMETLLVTTMSRLVDAAIRQQLIGANVEVRDLLRLQSAVCQIEAGPAEAARMVALVVDGLRYRRPAR